MTRNYGHDAMTSISKTTLLARTGLFGALTLGLSACAGGLFGGGDGDPTTPTVGERIPILSRIETGAQVDPSLASVQVVLPPAQTNTSFAQAGGTASKSYGHLALGQQPTKVWTAQIAGSSNRARLGAAPAAGRLSRASPRLLSA